MKYFIFLMFFSIIALAATFENLKVGDSSAISSKALFEVKSTTKGMLPPRLTSTQRIAISSPVDGLIVYDTTLGRFCMYNSVLSSWSCPWPAPASSVNSNRIMVSSGGSVIENSALTASKVMITDSNGLPTIENALSTARGGTFNSVALNTQRIMVSTNGSIVENPNGKLAVSTPMRTDSSGYPTTGSTALGTEVSGTLSTANGGTFSSTALVTRKIMVSTNGAIVENPNGSLTASTPMRTDANGYPTTGSTALGTEVSGTLSTVNGGTFSSSPLLSNRLMVSYQGSIAELQNGTNGQILQASGLNTMPTWVTASASGVTSVGTIDSNGTSANGATISGTNIYMQSASGTVPGLVNNSAQYLGGNVLKTMKLNAPNAIHNYSLTSDVTSGQLAIYLKDQAGATPSSTSPVFIPFRNTAATPGDYSLQPVTSALSIVIYKGASIGIFQNTPQYAWVHALYDGTSVLLGVDNLPVDDGASVSTTAIIGSSAVGNTLYANKAMTSVPVKLLGRVTVTNPTVTTWTWPTDVTVLSARPQPIFTEWQPSGFGRSNSDGFCCTTSPSLGSTTITVKERREGDSLHVKGFVLSGTVNAAPMAMSPTATNPVDTGKCLKDYVVGTGAGFNSSTTIFTGGAGYFWFCDGINNSVFVAQAVTTSGYTKQTASSGIGNASTFSVDFTVPIYGWSLYGP